VPKASVAFTPDDNSLQLVANITAEYNDTAWGIGYHIHLSGTLSVSCSFSTYSDVSGLHVAADISTASTLGDVTYDFDVDGLLDVVGKALDDFTPIVDNKVNSLANDIDLATTQSIDVGIVPGATKCEPIVYSNFLAFEIAY
jgi:hypothetical protein